MFQVYDYDNDKCLGIFADIDTAEFIRDEYENNYGETVEVCVEEID